LEARSDWLITKASRQGYETMRKLPDVLGRLSAGNPELKDWHWMIPNADRQ
jgi:hypothetical protein